MVTTGSFVSAQSMFSTMVSLATTAPLTASSPPPTTNSSSTTSPAGTSDSISNADPLATSTALGNGAQATTSSGRMGVMFFVPVLPVAIMPMPVMMPTPTPTPSPTTPPAQTPTPAPTSTDSLSQAMTQQMGMLLQLLLMLLNAMQSSSQQQNTSPCYNSGSLAKVTGDPHFTGFDGEKYDVMGQNGGIYNILSDNDVQYNSRFANWGMPRKDGTQPTVIDQAAIQVGNSEVYFDRSGKAPTVNGKSLVNGQCVSLGDGKSASWDGTQLTVNTGDYTIALTVKEPTKNGGYINSSVKINQGANPLADGVAPHGLLGQTADGVVGVHKGLNNTGDLKQGGTVIDGTVNDYKVSGLWNNDFKFNKFHATAQQDISPLEQLLNSLASGLAA